MIQNKDAKDYIRSQSMAAGVVTNDNLMCKDCRYRNNGMPTAFCDKFPRGKQRKPNAVLLGKNCSEYSRLE